MRLHPALQERDDLVLGPYRGAVELAWRAPGRLTVVNELNLEDYVRGVVSVVPQNLVRELWPSMAAACASRIRSMSR